MPLKLGSQNLILPTGKKLYRGSELIYPLDTGGFTYDPRVTHAWNPIDGADASANIPNLISGGPPLKAVGASGANPNWDGEFDVGAACVLPYADMDWYWDGDEFTITSWIKLADDNQPYSHLWGIADGNVTSGSDASTGSFSVVRTGNSNGFGTYCRTSYNAGASASGYTIPTDTWLLVTTRMGANKWRTIVNDYDSDSSLSWLGQDIPPDIGVGFSIGYARNLVDGDSAISSTSGNFRGHMKDMRIWNESISDADITALVAAGPAY